MAANRLLVFVLAVLQGVAGHAPHARSGAEVIVNANDILGDRLQLQQCLLLPVDIGRLLAVEGRETLLVVSIEVILGARAGCTIV